MQLPEYAIATFSVLAFLYLGLGVWATGCALQLLFQRCVLSRAVVFALLLLAAFLCRATQFIFIIATQDFKTSGFLVLHFVALSFFATGKFALTLLFLDVLETKDRNLKRRYLVYGALGLVLLGMLIFSSLSVYYREPSPKERDWTLIHEVSDAFAAVYLVGAVSFITIAVMLGRQVRHWDNEAAATVLKEIRIRSILAWTFFFTFVIRGLRCLSYSVPAFKHLFFGHP